MKRFISLVIGCSLAVAGAAMAQQPDQQATAGRKKQGAERAHAAQGQPGANAPKAQEHPAKQAGAMKEHPPAHERGAMNEPAAAKGRKGQPKSETAPETNVSGQ